MQRLLISGMSYLIVSTHHSLNKQWSTTKSSICAVVNPRGPENYQKLRNYF
ncbi:unnamed protein product [Acanthoscelides obtectus]|uniref:Uncharacterized protein n=1 Tax=Acanthoscelides obtectus TaxID=200917 RepID=A0A9P0Q144_ACAOB|nr:unnamed protein product [Acanthoscelides obtectus]CAK1634089.1 hypothetical protein AOBTE_LOCUS8597 [Acanthoscelides obtectus]